MIVENQYLEELLEIFDNNKQEYVEDRTAIQSGMTIVVYVENNVPLGYAAVYEGKDFCEQEEYPIIIEDLKKDSVYIWQMITKKGFESRGIGTSIVKYIIEKYKDSDIYVCVDINNQASMKCQCKCGFIPIKCFQKVFEGKICDYIILRHQGTER